ncbi:MAG: PAS domain S-box protein [Candidatus Delongbacteria bacterium]|jgi:PAS domain S-box-containing protein|nr:PAS domain S-box protein [Candidatus Delongbacteria bacterium]
MENKLDKTELNTKLGHWEIDLNNNSVTLSEGAKTIFGLHDTEINLTMMINIPLEEYRIKNTIAFNALVREDEPYDVTYKFDYRNSGEIKTINSTAKYDKEKNIVYGVVKEIENAENELQTSNQQLLDQTEELARMATVVNDSNDAITIQDLDGNITAWNTGAIKMYGYSEIEAIKKNVADLVPKEYKAQALNFITSLKKGKLVESLETKRQTKDGKILDIWMVVTKLVDEDGKLIGAATTERDITDLKKEEEKLIDSNQQLRASEQKLSKRIKELDCLYSISKICKIHDISLEEILQKVVEQISASWRYPEIAVVRIVLDGIEYKTLDFRKTNWSQCSDIIVNGNHAGDIEVYYLEKKPDFDEEVFLKEERLLLDEIAKQLGNITERMQRKEEFTKYRKHLEELVNNRTSELKQKNDDLERLNKFFINREQRIKELRDEVKRLSKE